jgi:hypothetical protein
MYNKIWLTIYNDNFKVNKFIFLTHDFSYMN